MGQNQKAQEKNNQGQYVSDTLVDTSWSSYDVFTSAARRQSEAVWEFWQKSWHEVNNWSSDQRGKTEKLVEELKSKDEASNLQESHALHKVVEQMASIALLPFLTSLHVFEEAGQTQVSRQMELAKEQRDGHSAWWKWHDTYTSNVKNQQRGLFRMMEDSMRVLTRASN